MLLRTVPPVRAEFLKRLRERRPVAENAPPRILPRLLETEVQARPFHENVDRDRLVGLIEDDGSWHASSINLHLSCRGDHLVCAAREGEVGAYLDSRRA